MDSVIVDLSTLTNIGLFYGVAESVTSAIISGFAPLSISSNYAEIKNSYFSFVNASGFIKIDPTGFSTDANKISRVVIQNNTFELINSESQFVVNPNQTLTQISNQLAAYIDIGYTDSIIIAPGLVNINKNAFAKVMNNRFYGIPKTGYLGEF